jgi:hypothetical protein
VTLRGLKDFFMNSLFSVGEDTVRKWLANLGYDEHLFNVDSRSFTLTFHAVQNFKVLAKDAIKTDLDNYANTLISEYQMGLFGPQRDFQSRDGMYYVIYSYSEDVYSYSYSALNTSDTPIELTIDLKGKSKNMLYLPECG